MKEVRIRSTVVLAMVVAFGLTTGCSKESNTQSETEEITNMVETSTEEITSAQTSDDDVQAEEITSAQTADDPIQAEVNDWWKEKNELKHEAIDLIVQIDQNESSIDPDLFDEITYKQREFDKFRDLSRKNLSAEAYEELYYDIEDNWWSPIIYANQTFYLPADYYVSVGWASDNVIVDSNNEDCNKQRVYTLKDSSKAGYLVTVAAETPSRVVLIEPGTTTIHFQ